jgi:hypothetical protein
VSQSRLLPSWPPLALCTGCLAEQNSADRTDGLGYYCGKHKDGLIGENGAESRRNPRKVTLYDSTPVGYSRAIPGGMKSAGRPEKYPYSQWFDGQPHTLTAGVEFGHETMTAHSIQAFRRVVVDAAMKRRYDVAVSAHGRIVTITPRAQAVA